MRINAMSIRRVEPPERCARNVRAERERRGLSQEELGDLAELHRTEISLLERGRRGPPPHDDRAVARALGVEPARLIRDVH